MAVNFLNYQDPAWNSVLSLPVDVQSVQVGQSKSFILKYAQVGQQNKLIASATLKPAEVKQKHNHVQKKNLKLHAHDSRMPKVSKVKKHTSVIKAARS